MNNEKEKDIAIPRDSSNDSFGGNPSSADSNPSSDTADQADSKKAEIEFVSDARNDVIEAIVIDESDSQSDHAAAGKTNLRGDQPDSESTGRPKKSKDDSIIDAQLIPPRPHQRILASALARENVASTGGAVSAVTLGTLAIIGGIFTPFALINGVLGLLLGAWGLASPRKKLSGVGMFICVIGIIFPVVVYGYQEFSFSSVEPVLTEEELLDEQLFSE